MKKLFSLALVMVFAISLNAQKSESFGLAKQKTYVFTGGESHQSNYAGKGVVFSDDFEGGDLSNFTVVNGGDANGFVWSATDGNNAPACASISYSSTAHDDWLITPALICESGSYLKFWYKHRSNSYPEIFDVMLSTTDALPASFTVTLAANVTPTTAYAEFSVDLTAYAGQTVYIGIHSTTTDEFILYLDDFKFGTPDANDLAVTAIAPSFVMSGETINPQVTVLNNGTADQSTWTLTLKEGATVISTVTDAATISAGASYVVNMEAWTPAAGVHNLTAYVTLTGDANTSNDTLTQDFTAVLPAYTQGNLYGYNAYSTTLDQHIVDVNKTTGALTDIALATTGNFLSCGDYINGNVYGVEYGTNDLYLVNGDGGTYKVGTITGVNSITGIAYDATNDVVYLADYGTTSALYTLDMATLAATYVGDITTNLIIGIAAGNHGELWGIDISTDHFWTIDPATGAGTDAGALGAAIGYAQDMGYDRAAGILYGTLYTTEGGLYTIDVATGAATLVGTFTDEVSMCAIASVYTPSTATDILTFGFNGLTPAVIGTVNSTDHTVALTVPHGTDVTALVPTITISAGATVSPSSGVAQDFTSPITYTVTAEDGIHTQAWTVTVTIAAATYNVTFNVDMHPAIDSALFTPGTDSVYVTGYYGWVEPGTDIPNQLMTDTDGDTIYTFTTTLVDSVYQYKYFINHGWSGGEWQGGNNRTFTVAGADVTLNDTWCIIVSLKEFDANISVSPNPTSNVLNVTANQNFNVIVVDITGKIIKETQMTNNTVSIDMTNENAGIYIIRLSNENGNALYKIIKK